MRRYSGYSIVFAICIYLLSCAGATIYHKWEDKLDKEVTFSQIIENPQGYKGRTVYLGGTIINTLNIETGTQIEVLQKSLDSRMKPEETDRSEGRFLIMYHSYLDPAIYAPKRDIVVVGEISGAESKPLGEIEYQYPIITAQEVELIKQTSPKTRSSFGIGLGIGGFGIGVHN